VNTAVWWLEWRNARRRPRVALFSVLVPLGLVLAVSLGRAPAPHAALVFAMLFTFFGTFGAAVPWARDTERGWIHRILLAGVHPAWALAQRWAASALLDLLELLPSLACIALVYRTDAGESAALLGGSVVGLLAANALGILVAHVAKSLAETALLASVVALLLLHAAGAFRTPDPGSLADAIRRAVPFHYLLEAVRGAVGA
jgi:hypothetical protein